MTVKEREDDMQAERIKYRIMEAAIEEFNKKGLKFTMDDVSKSLGMSKKTLYKVFADKEALFFEMVDYCFDSIKESERAVLEDKKADVLEKIRRIMIVLPKRYANLDFRQIYSLKEKYPDIYRRVETRLENDWEPTIQLLEQGMEEGKIKPVSIPVLKTMVEGSIELFLSRDVLIQNNMEYREALEKMMDIIMEGITLQQRDNNNTQ